MAGDARARLGATIALGRRNRSWTQRQLGLAAGLSRSMVGALESGTRNATVDAIERISTALGAELVVELRLPTVIGRVDQLDPAHAHAVASARRALERRGLRCATEIDFADGRLRGWIDLLAFDPLTACLLVVEVKTELRDIGGLQRQLGWYARNARGVAQGLAWRPRSIVPFAVLLATAANDAVLVEHRRSIESVFALRGSAALAFLAGEPDAGHARHGWGLAMIDPRRRGNRIWSSTRIDGRRSPAPYRSYADFMAATTRR